MPKDPTKPKKIPGGSPFVLICLHLICIIFLGGARGVTVIVVGNGHGDTSSNPGRD